MSESPADPTSLRDELDALRRRVAELTERELTLRDEADLYARILDSMTEMVVVKRADLSVAYANRAYCEFYGKAREDLIGQREAAYADPKMVEKHAMEDRYIINTGNLARSPVENLVREGGRTHPYTSVRTPLRGRSGDAPMVVTVLRSVEDDQFKVEQALKRSQEHGRALMQAIPDMVFRLGRDGTYLEFSSAKDATTAVPSAVFLGKKLTEILPDIAPTTMACVENALRTGQVQTMEYSLLQSGAMGYFEARITPSGSDEVVAIIRDITEEKRLEETLRESESRFRSLVEQSLVGIGVLAADKIGYASPKLADIYGYTLEELDALPNLYDIIVDEDREAVRDTCLKLLTPTEFRGDDPSNNVRISYRVRRKDGALIDIDAYMGRTIWGNRPALLCTILDVTDKKRVEEEQRRMQEDLVRAQTEVLADLSTPVIPINEHVLVMPLVGDMDETRASRAMERLLDGIVKNRARTVILDITGMPSLNTQAAGALVRCAQAVRLLGAEVVLTGIRPEVAQTLTALSVDLRDIVTLGTLQTGISYAVRRG